MLLVVISTLWAGKESLLVDTGIPRLVKGCDPDLLVSVFLNDAKGILVSIERGHEDERDIDAAGHVEMLDLANGKVEESHVVLDFEGTFGAGHTWRRRT